MGGSSDFCSFFFRYRTGFGANDSQRVAFELSADLAITRRFFWGDSGGFAVCGIWVFFLFFGIFMVDWSPK